MKRLYLRYLIATRKKQVYTENEKEVISVIRKMCSNKNTEIEISKYGYLITNIENHVDSLISGNSVIIINSIIVTRNTYSEKIIKKLNKFCENRVTKNCEFKIQNMFERENVMLNDIKQSI